MTVYTLNKLLEYALDAYGRDNTEDFLERDFDFFYDDIAVQTAKTLI